MQAGVNQFGKLYIKFALNFAIPLARGSQDIFVPTKQGMKNIADGYIGKPFTLGIGGPVVGKITDYETPVTGHYIFQVIVDDQCKDIVLKALEMNHPSVAAKLHDVKDEHTVDPKKAALPGGQEGQPGGPG